MLFVFLKLYLLRKVIRYSVNSHSHKAALANTVKLLDVFALSAADDRRKYLDFCARFKLHNSVNDCIHALTGNLSSADGAVRYTDPRIEQSQIIIYFRNRSDRGARIF